MSHEHFLRMHDAFRAQKARHGIDMLNPRGVTIGDNQYPAVHKTLLTGTLDGNFVPKYDDDTPQEQRYESIVHIPLESGNRMSIDTFHDGYVSASLVVPKIHIGDNGERTYTIGHISGYKGGDKYHQLLHEPSMYHRTGGDSLPAIHDLVKKWSKFPTMGTYDWDGREGFKHFQKIRPNYTNPDFTDNGYEPIDENLLLNTDELSEHRQNYKGDPVKENPNLVRVWVHNGPNTDRASSRYTYNTKTEQLFKGHGE